MERQQMTELLLAKLEKADANRKADHKDLLARMDANTKAMKEIMNKMKDEIKEAMNANRKAKREV
jgi:hypothetical protein